MNSVGKDDYTYASITPLSHSFNTDIYGSVIYHSNAALVTTLPSGTQKIASTKDSQSQTPLSGSGVPSTTPDFIGQFYIDTTSKALYYSVDTTSSLDWRLSTGVVEATAAPFITPTYVGRIINMKNTLEIAKNFQSTASEHLLINGAAAT